MAEATPPAVPTTISRYKIVERLGTSSLGEIYRGFDPLIERPVAVKLLRLTFADERAIAAVQESFFSEMSRAGNLVHPGIVTLFDVGLDPAGLFTALEFFDSTSLAALVAEHRAGTLTTRIALLSQVADALDYAHGAGVAHLNLKPSNILVGAESTVKVGGFGMARVLDAIASATATPASFSRYVAPERVKGAEATERADIFGLAAIAQELLGGTPVSDGADVARDAEAGSPQAPPDPSVLGLNERQWESTFGRALAMEPSKRFDRAGEFLTALADALGVARPEPGKAWTARVSEAAPASGHFDLSESDVAATRTSLAKPAQPIDHVPADAMDAPTATRWRARPAALQAPPPAPPAPPAPADPGATVVGPSRPSNPLIPPPAAPEVDLGATVLAPSPSRSAPPAPATPPRPAPGVDPGATLLAADLPRPKTTSARVTPRPPGEPGETMLASEVAGLKAPPVPPASIDPGATLLASDVMARSAPDADPGATMLAPAARPSVPLGPAMPPGAPATPPRPGVNLADLRAEALASKAQPKAAPAKAATGKPASKLIVPLALAAVVTLAIVAAGLLMLRGGGPPPSDQPMQQPAQATAESQTPPATPSQPPIEPAVPPEPVSSSSSSAASAGVPTDPSAAGGGAGPTASAASAATAGAVRIVTRPAGAAVTIDGRPVRAVTPARLRNLTFGDHTVVMTLDGFEPKEERVRLSVARPSGVVDVDLVPVKVVPTTGALALTTEPSGARVLLDGAPSGASPASFANLAPGRHTVRVEHDGFEPTAREVEIQAGETATLTLRLTAVQVTRQPEAPTIVSFDSVQVKPQQTAGEATPPFPPVARQARLGGFAQLAWVVDEKGAVTNVRVVDSSSKIFAQAALDWIHTLRFTPGQHGGRPVKVTMERRFTFSAR